jgi:hypothetical protein
MFPNDVIARDRVADRVREGGRERLSRQSAHARAIARRARVRGALNLVVGHIALARRKRVVHSA